MNTRMVDMSIFPAVDKLEADWPRKGAPQTVAVVHTVPHVLAVRQNAPRIADHTADAAERRTVDPCFGGGLRC